MNQAQIWNHYKIRPEWKEKLILFVNGSFYSTFGSDAVFLSQLFGFKIIMKSGSQSVGFPIAWSDKYLQPLESAWYSYVIILVEDSKQSIMKYHLWDKSLEISVPIEIYNWLLEELRELLQKYETQLLLYNDISLPEDSIPFEPVVLPTN